MKRVIVGLGLAAGAAFLLWPEASTVPPDAQAPVTAPAAENITPPTPPVNGEMSVGKFALSLRDGMLVPTPTIIALFNDWLGDTQSQRYEEWKPGALEQAAALPPAARDQLAQWLDQYVELNFALQLMTVKGEPTWDNILTRVRNMRDEYFGDEAASLFSEQIALENFTEAAVTAFADGANPLSSLVDLEQQANTLPPEARHRAGIMLNQLSQALQQDPALNENTDEWNRLVQANAAATLETPSVDLTEASAGFLQRYNAYAAEREALLEQGASEEQVKALRVSRFEGAELMRAGTLDNALSE